MGCSTSSRIPKSSASPCFLKQYFCFYFDFMCSFFKGVSQAFCLSYTRVLHQEFLIYKKIPQHKFRQYSVTPEGTSKKVLLAFLKNYFSYIAKISIFSLTFIIQKLYWTSAFCINCIRYTSFKTNSISKKDAVLQNPKNSLS